MVKITTDAAEKLKQLIAEENRGISIPKTSGVRFSVKVREENKFPPKLHYKYRIALESAPKDTDMVIESRGIKIFIDPDSQQHLKGSLIFLLKYSKSEMLPVIEKLSVENPNTKSAYGCGQPFEPK